LLAMRLSSRNDNTKSTIPLAPTSEICPFYTRGLDIVLHCRSDVSDAIA
jgi:hypothetical protein